MAKVLVTGGAGFIGSHIVDHLLEDGHQISVIDNLSSGFADNLPPSVQLFQNDIRSKEAKEILLKIRPEIIVHAAAQISVRISMEDPALDVDINIRGLVNLLSACTGDYSPYWAFLSTGGAMYGIQETFPARESDNAAPQSVYGMSKRVSEMYLDLWRREYQLNCAALRLANVYGPRQNPHGEAGVVAVFCERLLKGQEAVINGDGKQTRDYVYVKDVARAVREACRKKIIGTYNIGTARETDVNALYNVLTSALGIDKKAVHGPEKIGEQKRSSISPELAFKTFAWKSEIDLETGLEETAKWFQGQYNKS